MAEKRRAEQREKKQVFSEWEADGLGQLYHIHIY